MATEREWLDSRNSGQLTAFLLSNKLVSYRKGRLFAVACCRAIPGIAADEELGRVIEASEILADQPQRSPEFAPLFEKLRLPPARNGSAEWAVLCNNTLIPGDAMSATWYPALLASVPAGQRFRERFQLPFLRDVFGNPFRKVQRESAWLAWNDATVPRIAQTIYDERAFDRLPILGDALEDAGCDNADILNHCRGDGPHVRGCWVVDLLLGKQ
jgi:hypothetical protein